MIQKILVITPEYPSEKQPYIFTFVDQLLCAVADKGIEVIVISPYDMLKTKSIRMKMWDRKTPKGNWVKVYRPGAITLTTRKIGPINICRLSEALFKQAVQRTIKRRDVHPNLIYAHFLFPAGTCAASIGKKMRLPSICAFGESSLWSIREIGIDGARKRLSDLSGVVAVSTNNKNVLLENGLICENKITVIPNAVNKNFFSPGDKIEARNSLGLPQKGIIGIFNGSFSYGKGSLRVAEASKNIKDLSMIYLGGGNDEPMGENIIFKGRVSHTEVPTWLRAADFFVLPTLEEGCSNALVEAMSIGLPIITSDRPFNYDILDNESALLVNPLNIDELHDAMSRMVRSETLRTNLGKASLKKSKDLDIDLRAERIIEFAEKIIAEY